MNLRTLTSDSLTVSDMKRVKQTLASIAAHFAEVYARARVLPVLPLLPSLWVGSVRAANVPRVRDARGHTKL